MANRFLQKIQNGEDKLIVSLWAFNQRKEDVTCTSIEEASELLNREMAKGWEYRAQAELNGLEWDSSEWAEVEVALGMTPVRDLIP